MNKNESFIIEGLAGEKSLEGSVTINGAKNSALKAMAAAILFDGPVILENVPNTDDIHTMSEILINLGAKVEWFEKKLKIDATDISKTDIDPKLAKTMRASVVLTGPLLARFGRVSFPAPGGCVIGSRPIDLFIEGYKKMGAIVTLSDDLYIIEAPKGLLVADISFNRVSVGGTETLMMAAVLSKGRTVLTNCAMEPEIGNVAEWLNACGANISGVGTSKIIIEGRDRKLLNNKISYTAIPDRIEAGSFLILGALCAKELFIENCRPDHLDSVINILKESGVNIEILDGNGQNKTICVKNNSDTSFKQFKTFNIRTQEYPGFPTDLQAPMVIFLTQVMGESKVVETIFEGRFKYVDDLLMMGANITVLNPLEVLIKGPTQFVELSNKEELYAYDIRAGFAIVLAALIGKGKFKVNNVHLIDRGYESLEKRLFAIGANIKRV